MICYGKMLPVPDQKQVLHIDDAHHIVRIVLVDRKTGVALLPEYLQQLLIPCINIDKGHIDPGYHDIPGYGIAQIKYVIDHFLFF